MQDKVYSLANQGAASVFSFALIVVSTQLLSPEDFGFLSLVILVNLLVSVIPQSFIFMPIMSSAQKNEHHSKYFFNNFLILSICLIVVSLLLWLAFLFNIFDVNKYVNYYSIIFYFISFHVYEFTKKIMYVKNLHRKATIIEIIKFAVVFILMTTVFSEADIDMILIIASIGYICFIMFSYKNLGFTGFDLKYITQLVRKNYIFGVWIFLANTIQNINTNFYIYVSALLLPLEIIGVLNVVRSFIGISTVFFLAMDNYLTPKYAIMYAKKDVRSLNISAIRAYRKAGFPLLIIYILVGFFAENILNIVYGEYYAQYSSYVYLFLIANIFMYLTRPILMLAKTIGATRLIFNASLPPLIAVIGAGYIIIQEYQVNGALFIMLVTQLVSLISLLYFYRRTIIV